jgi:hypothetical protein
VLSVPEDFTNFACAIVHPSFEAPWSANPIGTGAYTLTGIPHVWMPPDVQAVF